MKKKLNQSESKEKAMYGPKFGVHSKKMAR